MATRARYKGRMDAEGIGLDYYNGIPARDLQDDEYEALDTEQKRQVRYGGLYAMADARPAKPEAARAEPSPPKQEGGGA